jgi:hypothetical protein
MSIKETSMKLLIALLAAGGLCGCVAYPAPYGAYDGGAYGAYGGSYGYYGNGPYVVQQRPYYYDHRGYRSNGGRDRDRDGIPNRYDRDRDGDGVPNRRDAAPNDPRRY